MKDRPPLGDVPIAGIPPATAQLADGSPIIVKQSAISRRAE